MADIIPLLLPKMSILQCLSYDCRTNIAGNHCVFPMQSFPNSPAIKLFERPRHFINVTLRVQVVLIPDPVEALHAAAPRPVYNSFVGGFGMVVSAGLHGFAKEGHALVVFQS